MTQPFADALTWVSKSRAFGATLAQANDLARAQSHAIVTLEHLLLALLDDADAIVILDACKLSRTKLGTAVQEHLGRLPQSDLPVPSADPALIKIVQYAAAAAQQSGRREVTGAIVLAALVGDGNSPAAKLLKAAGLTFQDAVRALQTGAPARAQASAAQPHPSPPSPPAAPYVDTAAVATEDALTAARRRVAQARGTPSPSLAPRPEQTQTTKAPEIAGEAQTHADAPGGTSQPPPLPPAAAVGDAGDSRDEADGETGSDTALPGTAASQGRDAAGGWLPPPLPAQPARSTRLPPPIPPLQGPHPTVPEARPPAGETPPSVRTIVSAPWAEAAVPVPGPVPPVAMRPFDAEALIDAIPERMRVGAAETIEIRIPRSEIHSLGPAATSSPLGLASDGSLRKAISVRLRSKAGGMTVEPASPETQWVDRRADSLSDEHVRWRWVVTPKRRGTEHLVVSVGCHTISPEGLTAETMLPEQSADVAVRMDWRRSLRQAGGWLTAMCLGALLMKLADGVVSAGVIALARLAGG